MSLSKQSVITPLTNIFKNCLDLLRDNEGLTGDKALKCITYYLTLKLIESHFGNKINIDNYNYEFPHVHESVLEIYKTELFKNVRFSNLVKLEENELKAKIRNVWEDILSCHPITCKIFTKDTHIELKYNSSIKQLIKKLDLIDMGSTDYDVLGSAYEEVIQDIMTGKVLGQFFTQPLVKKMMVKLIDPQIKTDGKFESCCDPTMGTGGFLISYLQCVLKQAKEKEININWDYVVSDGLYGKELDRDTYRLAVSNMLISSGHIFNNLERGDSIREPITKKFDCVLANPPFGIDSLKYDELNGILKTEYIPIKSNNAVSLFLQAIIHILKIDGRCAIVLPDGQDLFSKTNKALIMIRMYLMKTCDLKEVIYLPAGIFTYTSIKTCVFYFVKKCEGRDILTVGLKMSRTGKETNVYEFVSTHQTVSVKFYDYNPFTDVKKLLVDVPIGTIIENKYSLNYAEYTLTKDVPVTHPNGDITVKTLGEICEFLPKSKRRASYGQPTGLYPFYTSSQSCSKYCEICDYDKLCLILGTGGNANIKCDRNFSCSADNFVITTDDEIKTKYIYYYLTTNIGLLQKGFIGVGLKHISKEYISNIKVPLPPIEKQCHTVQYLNHLYEKAIKTSVEKIKELEQNNQYCVNNQRLYGTNVSMDLGEISIINPENMRTNQFMEINYIDISSVKGGKILSIQKLTSDFPSRARRVVREGDILYSSVRPNLKGYVFINKNILNGVGSTGFAHIRVLDSNVVLPKYLYYVLTSDYVCNDLTSKAKGAQYPTVSFEDFGNLKIPIPTLEIQKEIVETCDFNNGLIGQLENEIANNEIHAHRFIELLTKTCGDVLKTDIGHGDVCIDHEIDASTCTSTNTCTSTSTKRYYEKTTCVEKIVDKSKPIVEENESG